MNKMAIILVLLFLAASSNADDKTEFTGVWEDKWCSKTNPFVECGGFYLYLIQDGKHICGDHYAATPGLGRLNEGYPGSVAGKAEGQTALVSITSGRNKATYHAELKLDGILLKWRLTDEVTVGVNHDESLIARRAIMKKANDQKLPIEVINACK